MNIIFFKSIIGSKFYGKGISDMYFCIFDSCEPLTLLFIKSYIAY